MKKLLVITAFIFVLIACDDDKDVPKGCTQQALSFDNGNGITLDIDVASWQLTENGIGGGAINLIMKGQIIGDSATYRTYGDGLIYDANLELDSKKRFNISSNISFTATSIPEGEFTQSTLIRVFKDSDTLTVNLESCTLSY